MNKEQVFELIDSVLPFEVCLYHRVLPLSLEGSRLNLGMVDVSDRGALDYIRKMLGYLHCSLVSRPISSEVHQETLSAYLKSRNQQKTPSKQAKLIASLAKVTGKQKHQQQSAEPSHSPKQPSKSPMSQPIRDQQPPKLHIEAYHLSTPIELLATLEPKQLLQELLARVLLGGIGRLYFDRNETNCRILWSESGVVKSILEDLDPSRFQAIVKELKLMYGLPLIPVNKNKQVEIERTYNQSQILLILRLTPGEYGERATLQVLRGAALKFHKQRKLDQLSQDALNLARQLQLKVTEIRNQARSIPSLSPNDLENLPALDQLLMHVKTQIQELQEIRYQSQGNSDRSQQEQHIEKG
ncbi:hypothetical protein [Geitlerinema sp. PCC 9228]|jgi:hypothetical protein|uniref:GspE/PulE/PilB domain-containing protein n=1 Tax=Geitlerinema sp. PCC 9228 TaxID=111611 RepID=UPI0008F9BB9F|nr:hypothetical protein [Geitlerinema sp. PCC 9228]